MVKISVSFLGTDNKIEVIKKINQTDADYIHVDIADGKFVTSKTDPFNEMNKLLSNANKKLDVHLMVQNPSKYIEEYALLNTDCITIHSEIKDIKKHLTNIKNYGLKCGLAINPETPVEKIMPYINDINRVLIMSIEPGYSGQTFISSVLPKAIEIKNINKNILVAIDGGINEDNNDLCIAAGIDIICSATFVTGSSDFQYQITKLRR